MKADEIPEVIDNLRRIFQAVAQYSKAIEKETELTGPQLWALKLIAQSTPLRVSELARQMYLRPATVVGILDRLEMKNLITRNRSTEDRRAVDLNLSELGKEVAAKAPEVAQVMLVQGLESLTDEQFRTVVEGMQHMVRILGAGQIVPQPLHG